MKTLPTIAAGMLAAFLAFAPLLSPASAASVTVNVSPAGASGTQLITISGTYSPAAAGLSAFIQAKNPNGVTVISATAGVDPTAGTFTYSVNAGGNTNWVTGAYSVTVSVSGTSGSASFSYTAAGPTPTPSNVNALTVWVQATTPAFPGDTVQIATLVEWTQNGSLAATNFQTAHYHTPTGGLVNLGTPTTIHKGFYFWTITLPATAATGTYFVHVWVNNSGPQGQGLGSFTVSSSLASGASQAQVLTAVQGVSTAVGGIQSSLSTSLGQITTALTALQGAVTTLQTAATTTQAAAAAAQKAASDLSASVGTITSGVQSSQTYILVVAALAAITLVLELAILVRKLS